jgi:hypothetical protein
MPFADWPSIVGQFGRVTWSGYTDMGRIRIPPLPKYIALTDRADGVTVWYLQHNITSPPNPTLDGLGFISISNIQPRPDRDWVIFGPNDGPIYPGNATRPNIRLLVRGGNLGYEVMVEANAIDNGGRILTRRGVANETREIYRPTAWFSDHEGTLAWTPITIRSGLILIPSLPVNQP